MNYSITISDTLESTCISDSHTIELFDNDDLEHFEFLKKSNNYLYRCTHKRYKKPYAVKIYFYEDLDMSGNFQNEARFSDLVHPNIIEIHDYKDEVLIDHDFLMRKASYILMDLAKIDFQKLLSQEFFKNDEVLVRTYFRQLVEGVKYIHSKKIYHLDLKPDNLVLGLDNLLKLIDFDLAMVQGDDYLPGFGTRNFRAPELIRKKISDPAKCDIFSMAIILFNFKFGKLPYFEDYSKDDAYWLYRQTDAFFEKFDDKVSENFKKLFRAMTCEDPEARWSLEEVEASEWYNDRVYNDEELAACLKDRLGSK